MAFNFPLNPSDGQVVSHTASDGTILTAVYRAAKNEWEVGRDSKPPTSSIQLQSNVNYRINPGTANGQAVVWDTTTNRFVTRSLGSRELVDVQDVTPGDGSVLIWSNARGRYEPKKIGVDVWTCTADQAAGQAGATPVDKINTVYPLLNTAAGATPTEGEVIVVSDGVAANASYVGAWFYDGTTWLQAAGGGGGGATTKQNFRAATSTAQETGTLAGDLDLVTEPLKHQINVFDGAAWQELLHEESIKKWIAAGSLFQGVRAALAGTGDTIAQLPAPATNNKGFYWSWTGPASTSITPADFTNGGGFTATLQVGDWIQSDGTKYVHVPSDLLSKLRWESIGSFKPWADTNWEKDSLVTNAGKFYRAASAITTGDPAPGAAGSNWTDITPTHKLSDLTDVDTPGAITTGDVLVWSQLDNKWMHRKLRLDELDKVNANVQDPDTHGAVLQWDANIQEWVSSDTLQVSAIRFDDDGIGPEITGVEDMDLNTTDPVDESSFVPTVAAVKDYVDNSIKDNPKPFLEELDDCGDLATATDGQVPSWDAANNKWVPVSISSPIIYLGTGAWTAADIADSTKNYGMATDTQPDPKVWAPQPGDQYIDLKTGNVIVFTGASGGGTPASPTRTASTVTGGNTPGLDALIEDLGGLADVTLTGPATGNLLRFNTDHWENWVPDYLTATTAYTKAEVDTKLTNLASNNNGPKGVVHLANVGSSMFQSNALVTIGVTNFTFKAGRLYRVSGYAKIHIDDNTWNHYKLWVTNGGGKTCFLLSSEDQLDESDVVVPIIGEAFSVSADETRSLGLVVQSRRSGFTTYYSWYGGSQIIVEDLGPA